MAAFVINMMGVSNVRWRKRLLDILIYMASG